MPFRPRTGRTRSGLLGYYVKEVTEPDDLPDGVTLTDSNNFISVEWKGAIIWLKGRRLQLHDGINILSVIAVVTK